MNKNKLSPPGELVLTACLSSSLTIVLTLINIVLCTLTLIYRYECWAGDTTNGAQYFSVTILRTYILNDECPNSLYRSNLTKADTIFILAIIILVFAVINLLAAIALISVIRQEDAVQNVDITTYIYVGVCLAALVVDLTLAVHFGMDYETLSDTLALSPGGSETNYQSDMIRLGAFILMTLSVKGFIAHAINIILLILLTHYVLRYQQLIHENEHPIHKLGVLSAFDSPRRLDEPWNMQRNNVFMGYPRGSSLNPHEEEPPHFPMRENPLVNENSNPQKRLEDPWHPHRNDIMGYPKGPQVNPVYNHDEEPVRAPIREKAFQDSNRNNKLPDSWLHNQISARPFSYLEEPKRPIPVKAPTTPTNEPQWRRDAWPPAPPVPDPDYSPPTRRLRSALKSNYP